MAVNEIMPYMFVLSSLLCRNASTILDLQTVNKQIPQSSQNPCCIILFTYTAKFRLHTCHAFAWFMVFLPPLSRIGSTGPIGVDRSPEMGIDRPKPRQMDPVHTRLSSWPESKSTGLRRCKNRPGLPPSFGGRSPTYTHDRARDDEDA